MLGFEKHCTLHMKKKFKMLKNKNKCLKNCNWKIFFNSQLELHMLVIPFLYEYCLDTQLTKLKAKNVKRDVEIYNTWCDKLCIA